MLHNTAYKGIYRRKENDYSGLVPAIVDDATWEAAQQRGQYHPRRIASSALLSGLLRCGYCGAAMTTVRNHAYRPSGKEYHHRYYYCTRRNTHTPEACPARLVPAEKVERDVIERVFADLPAQIDRLLAEANARLHDGEVQDKRADLERRIKSTQTAISNLLDIAENSSSTDEIGRRIRERETALAGLRQQLAALPARPALAEATAAEVAAFIAELRSRLETGDIHTKRHILRKLIARLAFGPELSIDYQLPE